MKRSSGLVVAVLVLAACHQSPTGPPSGLPVTLSFVDTSTSTTTISSTDDSAVVMGPGAVLGLPFCVWDGPTPYAGIVGVQLVVTLASTQTAPVCNKLIVQRGPVTARIVVHQIPPGHYELVLVVRLQPLAGRATENEVARGVVALP